MNMTRPPRGRAGALELPGQVAGGAGWAGVCPRALLWPGLPSPPDPTQTQRGAGGWEELPRTEIWADLPPTSMFPGEGASVELRTT